MLVLLPATSIGTPLTGGNSLEATTLFDAIVAVDSGDAGSRQLFAESGPGASEIAGACGDGATDAGEQCDDGNAQDGDCCSASCEFETAGSACPDDGNPCTTDTCNGSGACLHEPGNAGEICRPQVAGLHCSVGSLHAGASEFPIALSQAWFRDNACGDGAAIVLFPASSSSCAVWHTFTTSPPSSATFKSILNGLAAGTFVSPATVAGQTSYGVVTAFVESSCSDLRNLFAAKKGADGKLVTNVAVHELGCSNVGSPVKVVGFARIEISDVRCTPAPALSVRVLCGSTAQGLPGNPRFFGTIATPCADCDVPEACDGSSSECPADGFQPAGIACRTATGVCDLPEACSGSSAWCPSDDFVSAATTCRGAAGACDLAETCTGSSGSCPSDGFASQAAVCRNPAGACDAAETCSGSSVSCPADSLASQGTVCRAPAGACDVAETCTGSSISCPADSFAAVATICRASAGVCDMAEACTGSSSSCPVDAFTAAATICRASAGVCDMAEACTGSSASCPSDAFTAAATICRASAGACDLAEACTGIGSACPVDMVAEDGTACDDGTAATSGDRCETGICVSSTDCDDADPCTEDSTGDDGVCTHRPAPAARCLDARSSGLQFKLAGGGQMRWKWLAGEETTCEDLGQPDVDDSYVLCVFDDISEGEHRLATRVEIAPGSRWSHAPASCRWRYSDTSGMQDGVGTIQLSPGPQGRSSIRSKAGGPLFPVPEAVSPDRFLTMNPGVTAQLHATSGQCWQSRFTEALKNSGDRFKTRRKLLLTR